MKKKILTLTLAFLATTAFVSCADDDVPQSTDQNITVQALENTLNNHDGWYVTEFFRGGIDHTPDYDGWAFGFAGETVTASYAGDAFLGDFYVYAADEDSNPNTPAMLNLYFTDSVFVPLSDDWRAIERNGNYVRLRSGAGPVFDYLAFTRE